PACRTSNSCSICVKVSGGSVESGTILDCQRCVRGCRKFSVCVGASRRVIAQSRRRRVRKEVVVCGRGIERCSVYIISFPFRIVRSVSQAEDCNVARTAKRREQCLVGDEGAGNCYVPPVKYKLRGFESSAKCWQEAVGIDVERRVHLCRRGAHRARAEEN